MPPCEALHIIPNLSVQYTAMDEWSMLYPCTYFKLRRGIEILRALKPVLNLEYGRRKGEIDFNNKQ
jgi:hypothetical protein